MNNYQIQITQKGGPEVLQGIDKELSAPQSGEVQVKIKATGVAFADLLMRLGAYPGVPPFPFTPGYDIVGAVNALPNAPHQLQLGQLVAALTTTGGYAQYINLSEKELTPLPEGIDPIEASALVLNYVTAWQMLHRFAAVQPGESILVHGAAGGVGTALLQLALLSGLTVFGAASHSKHDLIQLLGAIPIDYRNEDFVARINQETNGRGVDVVFDGIGGNNLWRSAKALRPGGRLISFGFSSSVTHDQSNLINTLKTFVLLRMINLLGGKKARFYSIGDEKKKDLEAFKTDLSHLFNLLKEGQIKPVIAARLPLNQVAEAHRMLSASAVSGKIILVCD